MPLGQSARDWRVCEHENVRRPEWPKKNPPPGPPTPPPVDWHARCPDCGANVCLRRGEVITFFENNAYAGGVKPGQTWALADGTMVRIEDVRLMATFSMVGDTAAPLMQMDADVFKDGKPVLRKDGRWS